ncbi:GTP-binding protein [Seonamhaeicola sediminis]|uniref:GTP-binding protein n=1 Tax=Seonamhaeicola sediminis TaxID=2528206 RepID=A0A562YI90_9FLAO|nr:GTP-binding protein [Seonamhaeicola sediminis]TWO34478.1 GTP-binding protein [Seonamhaeicola sediminis]
MPTTNDIVLRPRFKREISEHNEVILKAFETSKKEQSQFIVTRLDNHVFIKFPKREQQFWTPQLHLEIDEIDDKTSMLHGLFGPNPTVWTMFMFFHFIVACLFIAFGAWAYSNWKLETDYILQIGIMILMVIIWFSLYFAGSIGKASSKNDMHKLNDFMNEILKKTVTNYDLEQG